MSVPSCVVITRRIAGSNIHSRREPLSRLVLRGRLADAWSNCFARKAWWVELDCGRQYLRAVVHVRDTHLENAERSRLLLIADPIDSERITWSEGRTAVCGRVELGCDEAGIYPLDYRSEAVLESTRLSAAASATLQNAEGRLTRLFRETIGTRPPWTWHTTEHTEKVRYVRDYFARAELFDVNGVDPFVLAARSISASRAERMDNGVDAMNPFGVIDLDRLTREKWKAGVGEATLDALEASTAKHQRIVRELCDVLLRCELEPQANSHVDVAVLTSALAVFYEVKTATSSNFGHQVRAAIDQLLEYRFRFNQTKATPVVRPVAIVEHAAEEADVSFARRFAASVGVDLVLWEGGGQFDGLERSLRGGCVKATA